MYLSKGSCSLFLICVQRLPVNQPQPPSFSFKRRRSCKVAELKLHFVFVPINDRKIIQWIATHNINPVHKQIRIPWFYWSWLKKRIRPILESISLMAWALRLDIAPATLLSSSTPYYNDAHNKGPSPSLDAINGNVIVNARIPEEGTRRFSPNPVFLHGIRGICSFKPRFSCRLFMGDSYFGSLFFSFLDRLTLLCASSFVGL